MIAFLTSSAYDEFENIQTKNSFLDNLKKYWNKASNVLYIASFPSAYEITDEYANKHHKAYLDAGLQISSFTVLDYRNISNCDYLVKGADVIILCGGHTPTENKFFVELDLKNKLKSFKGIIIATSAGSMNAASLVYAQPELPGETSDNYVKYFEGLSLTNINILPHYHEYKNSIVDNKRVYEDITYKDSIGRCFYAFPDGTYLLKDGSNEYIYGETYIIKDGSISLLQNDNSKILL